MGSGVATVGRRVYAVGLYWENSPSGRVGQAAKDAASQPGQQAEFYALRPGNKEGRVPQFGLGQKAAGHKAGMPVFAACLAAQQPGSWAGAFRMREGTVVVVVRDDLILPDGDQLYLNESDARERLLQEIGFGGLQRVFAPEAWSISGADSMPISLLLDERRDIVLRAVKIPAQILVGGGVIGVVLVIAIGLGLYFQFAKPPPPAQAIISVPFEQAPPVYPPPDKKWEKAPPPMDVVENCRAGLAQIPAAVGGWKLGALRCDGHSISFDWSHDKGMSGVPKGAIVNDTGSTAKQTIALPPLTARGEQDLWDQSDITQRYLAQEWPGSINRIPDDPPPPPPPNYKGPWNPPQTPWVKRSFTLTVPELPGSLALYIGDIPGAIVTSLEMSSGQNLTQSPWKVEGVIYENRNESHN